MYKKGGRGQEVQDYQDCHEGGGKEDVDEGIR
jgi:hypothetical protein